MAREIHDTQAQGFTGIVLQLEAAEQAFATSATDANRHLAQAKVLARESLQEARRSVMDLLPKALDGQSLEEALGQELRRFDAAGRETVTLTVSGAPRRFAPSLEASLLRICQESLTNVQRHAAASDVRVELCFADEMVSMVVRDDGVGFSPGGNNDAPAGFGLRGMSERARQLGGTLTVETAAGDSTSVTVQIPVGRVDGRDQSPDR